MPASAAAPSPGRAQRARARAQIATTRSAGRVISSASADIAGTGADDQRSSPGDTNAGAAGEAFSVAASGPVTPAFIPGAHEHDPGASEPSVLLVGVEDDLGVTGSAAAVSVPATTKAKRKRADAVPQWKNDAFLPGHPSSMTVLLAWLQDHGNYAKWKGSEGDTHLVLASDIAQRIREVKTKVERTPPAIVEKIKALEKSFRQANDFRLATGQGILDKASAADAEDVEEAMKLAEKSVEEAVLNFCPHYYDLAEVMGDRISANPTGSFSTTSSSDHAAATLRDAVGARGRDASEEWSELDDEDPEVVPSASGVSGTPSGSSGPKLEGRPSNTGRKFGKATVSTPKRKASAVEVAIETRSLEKTRMEAQLNEVKVRSTRLAAIMDVARELRELDPNLTFAESLEQAKAVYESV